MSASAAQSETRRTGPLAFSSKASLSSGLADDEAEEIRKRIAQGWRGPVLLRWLEQLVQDREERRQRERDEDQTDEP